MYYLAEARFVRVDSNGVEANGYRYKIGWSSSAEAVVNELKNEMAILESPIGNFTYTSFGPFDSKLDAEKERDKHFNKHIMGEE